MLTFKQFLCEGGKATEKHGTTRASKEDIDAALKFVSTHTGVSVSTLTDRLLGSTRLTHSGHQRDSGDIDIAMADSEIDMADAVAQMTKATGVAPYEIGGTTFSYAVPVGGDRKVQVDLMFVPDIKWAKFSHHASEHSKHKSAVRNELLHSALKFSMKPGEDIRVRDDMGNDVVRASRAYKLDQGVERIFKHAPKRKDGNGRVKSVIKSSPEEVRQTLNDLGVKGEFSDKPELIQDPEQFARLLFGDSAKAKDLMSTEQLINMIRKHKAKQADVIFKDAVKGIKRLKFPVPADLKQYA